MAVPEEAESESGKDPEGVLESPDELDWPVTTPEDVMLADEDVALEIETEEVLRAVAEESVEAFVCAVVVVVAVVVEVGLDEAESMGTGLHMRSQRIPAMRALQRSQRCL